MNYMSGEAVCGGDLVRYESMDGVVDKVLKKGSEEAEGFGCAEEGGVLIRILSNNDLYVLSPSSEEDLILCQRASTE